jgi:hypothetical protein
MTYEYAIVWLGAGADDDALARLNEMGSLGFRIVDVTGHRVLMERQEAT